MESNTYEYSIWVNVLSCIIITKNKDKKHDKYDVKMLHSMSHLVKIYLRNPYTFSFNQVLSKTLRLVHGLHPAELNGQLAKHYGQSVRLSVKQRTSWFVYLFHWDKFIIVLFCYPETGWLVENWVAATSPPSFFVNWAG